MKKAAVLLAALILSVFCAVSVFADGNTTIDVFAKAVYTLPDGCFETKADADGDHVAKLPDGVRITLTPQSVAPSLRLVIVPITEQDEQAYRWISACAADFGTAPLFYEVYYIDAYGNRVDVHTPTEISVALAKSGVLKAAGISADGTLSPLAAKSDGSTVAFTLAKSGYFVVASEKAAPPAPPETGDNGAMNPWIVLLLLSAAGAAGAVLFGRKKKCSEE